MFDTIAGREVVRLPYVVVVQMNHDSNGASRLAARYEPRKGGSEIKPLGEVTVISTLVQDILRLRTCTCTYTCRRRMTNKLPFGFAFLACQARSTPCPPVCGSHSHLLSA